MTETEQRLCAWCGDPIPPTLRKGSRYCGRRCSQHRGKTAKTKRVRTVNLVSLEMRLRQIEQQTLAEFRGRAA